ncbi:MAG: SUMF1/EgtB/PvdO family nonheme iron enzyme [Chitinophagales bacterium]
MTQQKEQINIFIAYSMTDKEYIDELRKHLFPLERNNEIKIWYDGEIIAGAVWEEEIEKHLHEADIILLLVSSDSLYSEYFYDKQVIEALERHEEEKTKVIPIVLSPCLWEETPLKSLEVLPQEGLPISKWENEDDAYFNVVKGISKSVRQINAKRDIKTQISEVLELEKQTVLVQKNNIKQNDKQVRQQQGEKEVNTSVLPTIKESRLARLMNNKIAKYGLIILCICVVFFVIQVSDNTITNIPKTRDSIIKELQNDMVTVAGGTFEMGCNEQRDGTCKNDEKPLHRVELKSFLIGKYEVSQRQWETIMGENPSKFSDCPDCPVEQVSWNDTKAFIKKLNQETGKAFRLPTEAEWEYAARGGKKSKRYKYAGSNDIEKVACYGNTDNEELVNENSAGEKGNELDLYEMSGNVSEWCEDTYAPTFYSNTITKNPINNVTSIYRILRGGSCFSKKEECRIANRTKRNKNERHFSIGFRLAEDL